MKEEANKLAGKTKEEPHVRSTEDQEIKQLEDRRKEVRKKENRSARESRVYSLLVGCLTSQQHASVCQGRICSDNFACCHTEIEVADPTFYLTQSQYIDTSRPVPALIL